MGDQSNSDNNSSGTKQNKFNFNKGFDSNTLIALIALIIGVFSVWRSCSQEEQIARINFQRMAEDYRPKLIASKPFNMNVNMKVDTGALVSLFNSYKRKDTIDVLIVPLKELKFNFSLWLYNNGNTQANLLGWLIMDSVYQGPLLKKRIKENFNRMKINVNIEPNLITIDRNDSLEIDIKLPIRNLLRNKIIIHFYFLYENENKFLYSSYTWIEFNVNTSRLALKSPDSTKIIGVYNEIKLNQNDVIYVDQHTVPSIVEPQDTAVIQDFFRTTYRNSIIPNKLLPDLPIQNELFQPK